MYAPLPIHPFAELPLSRTQRPALFSRLPLAPDCGGGAEGRSLMTLYLCTGRVTVLDRGGHSCCAPLLSQLQAGPLLSQLREASQLPLSQATSLECARSLQRECL